MGKIIFGFVVSMCCIRGFADEITNIEQCMNTNLTADVLSRFPSNPTSSVQSCVLTFVKGSVIGDMRLFASSFSAASRFSEFGIADLDDIPATISKGFFNLMTSVSNCTSKVMSYNEMTNNGVVKGNGVLEFDFLVGDWLPPVGKGKVADVRFERMPREDLGEGMNGAGVKGRVYRDSMTVSFLGGENGLVKVAESSSVTLRIRTAPEGGYCDSYNCWEGVGRDLQPISSYDKLRDFCFRIRTRKNDKGEIVEAFYGKIYGDISFAPAFDPLENIASVCMLYYLNPTPLDRNLEWDMKTNLCPNPGSLGQLQP